MNYSDNRRMLTLHKYKTTQHGKWKWKWNKPNQSKTDVKPIPKGRVTYVRAKKKNNKTKKWPNCFVQHHLIYWLNFVSIHWDELNTIPLPICLSSRKCVFFYIYRKSWTLVQAWQEILIQKQQKNCTAVKMESLVCVNFFYGRGCVRVCVEYLCSHCIYYYFFLFVLIIFFL